MNVEGPNSRFSIKDNKTRWNSTFNMFNQALKDRSQYKRFGRFEDDCFDDFLISDNECDTQKRSQFQH